jgi:phage terminase small subunit
MPRISPEARSAAAFLTGGKPPEPPKHLDIAAAAIWREIVASKPVDWFDAGAQVLLENYCSSAAHARVLYRRLLRAHRAGDGDEARSLERRLLAFTRSMAALARASAERAGACKMGLRVD